MSKDEFVNRPADPADGLFKASVTAMLLRKGKKLRGFPLEIIQKKRLREADKSCL